MAYSIEEWEDVTGWGKPPKRYFIKRDGRILALCYEESFANHVLDLLESTGRRCKVCGSPYHNLDEDGHEVMGGG